MGASHWVIQRRIILPLCMPGIIAGSIMVFLPAMTMFYIPMIVGGAKSMLLGNLIQEQFLTAENWPLGATFSILLMLIMSLAMVLYRRYQGTEADVL